MMADYLRVSVTDRCNLRCVYCYPSGGCDLIERKEILRFEEICRIVGLFALCGTRKVRLTGGEPLVRSDIVNLVRKLAGIKGIEELTLTTNGVLLEQMAEELKNAGLRRINISIDSTERQSYKDITGFDNLASAMKGINKALDIGLAPVKINCVIIKGLNVSQILPLAQMSIDLPVAIRFIEYCPTSRYTKPAGDFVPTCQIRRMIEREHGQLSTITATNRNGPALHFKIDNAAGTIGFISGRSSIFCYNCNRIRLTSDGMIKPCLYSFKHYNVKQLVRAGASDKEVVELLKEILREKDNFTKLSSSVREFDMQKIGG
ncbi:MAG: GTP 3',8-cyclase MoaA [Planctomycetota bacterium]|jgi:cyclic pyranopterin phosphate synthase